MTSHAADLKSGPAEWVDFQDLPPGRIAPSLASLITATGSLTELLRDRSPARFAVKVLGEGFRVASDFPDHGLDPAQGEVLVREVCLLSAGWPAVFAQTLVPRATLARHGWLGELGDEPLGPQLFAREDVIREPFQFTRLGRDHALARRALGALPDQASVRGDLWARRSLFRITGLPVSVNEVFFPLQPVAKA